MRTLILSCVLAASATCVAYAADLQLPQAPLPSTEQAYDFSGAFLGINAGFSRFGGGTSISNLAAVDVNFDGGFAGLYAGYAYQLQNNVVLGVEADVAKSWASGFNQGFGPGGIVLPPDSGQRFEVDWTGSARLKVGYAIDRFQPYIAGGVAFADLKTTNIAAGTVGSTNQNTMVGWTLGAGAEYALADNLVGRVEYRYTDYGSVDYISDGLAVHQSLTSQDVHVGLALKF